MSSVLYLEQFLESLEPLPAELKKNFNEMRTMDEKVEMQKGLAESLGEEYNKEAKNLSDSELKAKFKGVEKAWATAYKTQEEKLNLATQTYEMLDDYIVQLDNCIVDRHIRRLDSDLSRFESELAERGGLETTSPTSDKKVRREIKKGEDQHALQIAPQDVLDMPVDPNEPTYCLCHQVSYGEMIGCDNPDCPIEWFHFGCVGLSAKPKGKWFCARCKPAFDAPKQIKKKK